MQQLTERERKSWCQAHPVKYNDWFFIIVSREWLDRSMSLDGMSIEFWQGDKYHQIDRHEKSKFNYHKSDSKDFMVYWKWGSFKFFIQPMSFPEE